MKLSELGEYVVIFIDKNNYVVHEIAFNDLPNIVTLKENFNELSKFLSFDIDIESLRLDILLMKNYVIVYGDREITNE